MKNFEEIMSERKPYRSQKGRADPQESVVRRISGNDPENKRPFDLLMSYYQCAVMEIETKFRVLNQEYSWNMIKILSRVLKPELNLMTALCGKYAEKIFPCL